jgi:hypothetical protein
MFERKRKTVIFCFGNGPCVEILFCFTICCGKKAEFHLHFSFLISFRASVFFFSIHFDIRYGNMKHVTCSYGVKRFSIAACLKAYIHSVDGNIDDSSLSVVE